MKIIINTIAFIAFIMQFISFVFSALNQKKPQSVIESLHNDFVFIASFCSLFVVVIFVVQYNFDFKFLKQKFPNCIFLMIVLLGMYIHIVQLLTQKELIPISFTLLVFDFYCKRNILCSFLNK